MEIRVTKNQPAWAILNALGDVTKIQRHLGNDIELIESEFSKLVLITTRNFAEQYGLTDIRIEATKDEKDMYDITFNYKDRKPVKLQRIDGTELDKMLKEHTPIDFTNIVKEQGTRKMNKVKRVTMDGNILARVKDRIEAADNKVDRNSALGQLLERMGGIEGIKSNARVKSVKIDDVDHPILGITLNSPSGRHKITSIRVANIDDEYVKLWFYSGAKNLLIPIVDDKEHWQKAFSLIDYLTEANFEKMD